MRETVDEDQAYTLNDHVTVTTDMEIDEALSVAEDDLQNYQEATRAHDADKWEKSYDDELKSIQHHNVWVLIPQSEVPAGCCVLGCCTVFLQKHDESNEVSHHKTRIVTRRFSQIEGIDYKETFVPVAWLESVCTILALAASMD